MKILVTHKQFNSILKESSKETDENTKLFYQNVVNQTMTRKFSWWKNLHIITIHQFSSIRQDRVVMDAYLVVDKDWAKKRFGELNGDKEFVGNLCWDSKKEDDCIFLEEVLFQQEFKSIEEELHTLWSLTSGNKIRSFKSDYIVLKFE